MMKPTPKHQRPSGLRHHIAGLVAFFALAIALCAWVWMTYQPPAPQPTVVSLPQGVLVAAVITAVSGLLAELRAMSISELLSAIVEGAASLIAIVAALVWNFLKFVAATILELLGFNS